MTWTERRALGREPRNTWSNLAYFLGGFSLLFSPMPTKAAGVAWAAMTWLALGSARFHFHGTSWFRRLDHEGMYVAFGALAVFGWFPYARWAPVAMALAGIGLAFTFVYVRHSFSLDRQVIALGLLGSLPSFLFGSWQVALAGLALIAIARIAWLEDRKVVLESEFGLWGHAIWHALTAVGITLLFLARVL